MSFRRLRLSSGLALAALFAIASAASAQEQQPPTPRCDQPEHRQFDFWVGNWEVTTPDGSAAGTNKVERILDGCVIKESWAGGSMSGESYNIYSARHGRWHQTWVDTTGRLLQLDGGLVDGRMVLTGETPDREGRTVQHEISWEQQEDGTVKQHWRVSRDGDTWSDAFVGIYKRKG